MGKKRFFGLLAALIAILPLFTLCPAEEALAKWWDKWGEPQYGGSIVARTDSLDAMSFDPSAMLGPVAFHFALEGLFGPDETIDRDEWGFSVAYNPDKYLQGILAERWEMTDPQTVTIKVRKGVHWHNKAPVNGRELVADDIVFTMDRMLGTGHGFKPHPFYRGLYAGVKTVTAMDNYTVVFTFENPGILNLETLIGGDTLNEIIAPEWVALGEDPDVNIATDSKLLVGTGAFLIDNFVQGSSYSFVRNPDYWGTDKRFPENRLPYADKATILAIPDMSTTLAAMRTGKIDIITSMTWQELGSLRKTNPDVEFKELPEAGNDLQFRCDKKPFTDINVRKALQMAIDRKSIAASHYGGTVEGVAAGIMSLAYEGFYTPFSKWPADLKEQYSYNPEKAKELLAAAGYPTGFKTNVVCESADDLQLLEIVKSYFADIGVDMEIKVIETGGFRAFVGAGKHDQMAYTARNASPFSPWQAIELRRSTNKRTNFTYNNDTVYDGMIEDIRAAATMNEVKSLTNKADLYGLNQHWSVNILPKVGYMAWQPWIKGCSGETQTHAQYAAYYRARMWVNKNMK